MNVIYDKTPGHRFIHIQERHILEIQQSGFLKCVREGCGRYWYEGRETTDVDSGKWDPRIWEQLPTKGENIHNLYKKLSS